MYGQYEETAEWYGDSAVNQWRCDILELNQTIIFTCDDDGTVTEERIPIDGEDAAVRICQNRLYQYFQEHYGEYTEAEPLPNKNPNQLSFLIEDLGICLTLTGKRDGTVTEYREKLNRQK